MNTKSVAAEGKIRKLELEITHILPNHNDNICDRFQLFPPLSLVTLPWCMSHERKIGLHALQVSVFIDNVLFNSVLNSLLIEKKIVVFFSV